MEAIETVSDEQLWQMAAAGDNEAEERLINKYTRLVKMCARPYFLAGGDSEDLIQEGMLGLLSALKQYDPERDAQFKTFAELCIRNRLYTAIRSASRNKHTPLNEYVSLEGPNFDESQTQLPHYLLDPEELVIERERFYELTDSMRASLSCLEARILSLYLEGLSYSEIAQKVGKPPKSVDNAVQRIRKKLSQCI